MADPTPRWFRREPQRLILSLHVQPGARASEVAGVHGDSLRIRVQAPAIEDRANQALLEFVAHRLGVAKRDVTLASGARSREKKLHVPPHCDPDLLFKG